MNVCGDRNGYFGIELIVSAIWVESNAVPLVACKTMSSPGPHRPQKATNRHKMCNDSPDPTAPQGKARQNAEEKNKTPARIQRTTDYNNNNSNVSVSTVTDSDFTDPSPQPQASGSRQFFHQVVCHIGLLPPLFRHAQVLGEPTLDLVFPV